LGVHSFAGPCGESAVSHFKVTPAEKNLAYVWQGGYN